MGEIWKDIEGYEGLYQISNIGNIKRLSRSTWNPHNKSYSTLKEIILKPGFDGKYLNICLCNPNKKTYLIHRLVATHFIPNPENKPEVNHINGIKTDNNIINLEWSTKSENELHAFKNNLKTCFNNNKYNASKLTQKDVDEIIILFKSKSLNTLELSKKYNVTRQSISNIINLKTWKK